MAVNYEYKKNYYELLDVSPGSSGEEIERAYRRAAEAYSADSAALYSLCSEEQREGLLSEIRAAFETLTDPLKKREYDSKLNGGDHEEQEMSYEVDLRVLGEGAVRPEEKHPGPAPELIKPWNTSHLKRPLVITDEKEPFTIEQYRVLYTKLESISLRHSYKVFAVTSAVKGEGKTVTSLHLAHVMAHDFKKRVVLVECDLKKPSLMYYFRDPGNCYGLADVLKGEVEVKDAISRVGDSSLYLLPEGKRTANSTELFNSKHMKTTVERLKENFDFVIMDCPPVLPLADMNLISRFVDGILLVVRSGSTPKDMVLKSVNSIPDANIVGVVLNGANTSFKKYYY